MRPRAALGAWQQVNVMPLDPRYIFVIAVLVLSAQLIEYPLEFPQYPTWKRFTKGMVLLGTAAVAILSFVNAYTSYVSSSPRVISGAYYRHLVEDLKHRAGLRVQVVAEAPVQPLEACAFRNQIEAAFRSAGWQIADGFCVRSAPSERILNWITLRTRQGAPVGRAPAPIIFIYDNEANIVVSSLAIAFSSDKNQWGRVGQSPGNKRFTPIVDQEPDFTLGQSPEPKWGDQRPIDLLVVVGDKQ